MNDFMKQVVELTGWQCGAKEKSKLPGDKDKIDHLVLERWACYFYQLRSKIIHGSPIEERDYYFNKKKKSLYLEAADCCFLFCLIGLLVREKYYIWNNIKGPLLASILFENAFEPKQPEY
jgi:hypothetical protein